MMGVAVMVGEVAGVTVSVGVTTGGAGVETTGVGADGALWVGARLAGV
jgi:hypothetical protein